MTEHELDLRGFGTFSNSRVVRLDQKEHWLPDTATWFDSIVGLLKESLHLSDHPERIAGMMDLSMVMPGHIYAVVEGGGVVRGISDRTAQASLDWIASLSSKSGLELFAAAAMEAYQSGKMRVEWDPNGPRMRMMEEE